MRAMTLTQPWAGLVASGIKLVENRPRHMIKREDFGKPFAIHASREIQSCVFERIYEIAPDLLPADEIQAWQQLSRITSAVIAIATISGVVEAMNPGMIVRHADGSATDLASDQVRWFFGPIGYVLRDVSALETPIACRGQLGFWTMPDDIAARVSDQLARPG